MNRSRYAVWGLALLVAAATVFVSWPTVHDGLVFLDDGVYLEEAAQHQPLSRATLVWAFTTGAPFYYQPLTRLAHVLDWQFWGANLAGHHATSLAIHGLNAGLVVLLTWLVLGAIPALNDRERLTVSALVGLTFGIHPLQVESVAWLAERKNVLGGFFSLACLGAWVRAACEQGTAEPAYFTRSPTGTEPVAAGFSLRWRAEAAQPGRRLKPAATGCLQIERRVRYAGELCSSRTARAWWWVALTCYVAALLSKPLAVSLPLVMLVLDFYPLRRSVANGWGRLLKEKLLYFALAAGLAGLTVVMQARAGALTGLARQGISARLLVALRAVFFYLWKLIWPAWLCPYYPLEGQVTFAEPEFLLPVVLAALLAALIIWQRKRWPAVVAASLAYLALLLPTAGILQAGPQAAADRFMYLAMIPVLLLLAGGVLGAGRRLTALGRTALMILLAGELLFFGFRTRGQIVVWHDDETLWRTVLGYFPQSGFANCELADALSRRGQFAAALALAQRATLLTPDLARAHAILGYVDLKLGRPADAVVQLRQVSPRDSSFPASRYHLAGAYAQLGRLELAWETLQPLLHAGPGFAQHAASDPDLRPLRDDPRYGAAWRAGTAR